MKTSDQLIYGIRPVVETIKAGKEFDKIFVQNGLRGEHVSELFALLREAAIPYQRVPVEKLNRITRQKPPGCSCIHIAYCLPACRRGHPDGL